MRIPVLHGLIDRRILANYRIDPGVLSQILPAPFRPQVVNGFGIAGICLIRLKLVRPKFIPSGFGISSENAAHRVAVEWDVNGETRTGVFVLRRDTSSYLNALAGGRFFPGVHHQARFDVNEQDNDLHISMATSDCSLEISGRQTTSTNLPADSIFRALAEASQFFASGSLGYSPTHSANEFDGLELRCHRWQVQPLDVLRITSSFFDDRKLFPAESIRFDNALLMQHIDHEWHGQPKLYA